MELSANVRKGLYVAMYVANAVLVACVQQNVIPAQYLAMALTASLVAASLMKEFHAPETK